MNSLLSSTRVLCAVAAVSIGSATAVAATTPTPIPGGANQMKGLSGGLQSTLFNGKVRIRKMQLRLATPDEASPPAGETALTLAYIVSNGTSREDSGYFTAQIADADGVTIPSKFTADHPYTSFYTLIPGAAARGKLAFILPSGFTPVKIVLADNDAREPVFRIDLKPADIPAAAPAAEPSS